MQPRAHGLLSNLQKELLVRFFNLPDAEHFYLTGGTALAEYYLGHRNSFDLDLFTAEKSILTPFSRIIEEEFTKEFQLAVIHRFASYIEFEITREESVKIQLALDSPFRLEAPIILVDKVIINNFTDLTVDKLLAFFGRTEPRDAVDIFFILKHVEISRLLEMASRKDPGFDRYWLSVAFSRIKDFPDDINRWPVDMVAKIDGAEVKCCFAFLAKEIMKTIKPDRS